MAERRSTMMDPSIEDLLAQVDSKFTLVTLAAKRGRQINSYFNQLGEGLGSIVPPQVASVARKPLSIALEEVAAAKIGYFRPEEAEDDGAEGAGAETQLEAVPDVEVTEASAPEGEEAAASGEPGPGTEPG